MDEINIKEGVEIALDAIIQDRLSAICGAGLSMAAPSNIPCAWEVAQKAKEKYDGIFGTTRPALSEDIEKQAEYFHYRDELDSMYLERLVDNDIFSAPPNSGHFAVADLLLTQSIKLALSTNVGGSCRFGWADLSEYVNIFGSSLFYMESYSQTKSPSGAAIR